MASPYTYPVASGVYRRTPSLNTLPGTPDYSQSSGVNGVTGPDNLLMSLRDTAMSDAQAGSAGARYAAQGAAGNDPSMAAWAGLEALLRGQGNASRAVSGATTGLLQSRENQAWQQRMAQLYHQWQMEQQQSANQSALWGQLAQLGGTALTGWL